MELCKKLICLITAVLTAAIIFVPPVPAAVYAADDVVYRETGDEAAADLRQAMKERRESVTVGILAKTDQEGLKQVIGALLDRAVKHTGEPDEGDYINYQYAAYKGAAKTTHSGISPAIEVDFTLTYYDSGDQEKEVNTKVKEIISSLDLDRKTDYEKLTAIYDYICSNTKFEAAESDSDIRRTAYGALVNGKAVCQGYSIALYRLLLEAGIDNRIIFGKGVQAGEAERAHTWNIVELYGKYYYVDITWDDSANRREYFLRPAGSGFEEDHVADKDYPEDYFTETYPVSKERFHGDIEGSVMKTLWAAQDTEELMRQRFGTISG